MLKTVLFISYWFPPCSSIGGALRSSKFVKYLPEFGWEPFVLSLKEEDFEYSDNKTSVRIPTSLNAVSHYNLTPYDWAWNIFKRARKVTSGHTIRLIYVSCPPYAPAIAALRLKKQTKLPLVIDYRDAWTLNPLPDKRRVGRLLNNKAFPIIEKMMLTSADLFVTNTPSMREAYQICYPKIADKIHVVTNGFDETDFVSIKNSDKSSDKMTLLHCGRMGVSGRDPTIIFHSIKKLSELGYQIQLVLLGEDIDSIRHQVAAQGADEYIRILGKVDHKQAIRQMFTSDVLVVFQNKSKQSTVSAVAGKTYEYLRTGKPVLAIAPKGDNVDLVEEYAQRYEVVSSYLENDIIRAISRLYEDWRKGLLSEHNSPNYDYIRTFNRRALSKDLAMLFDSLIT